MHLEMTHPSTKKKYDGWSASHSSSITAPAQGLFNFVHFSASFALGSIASRVVPTCFQITEKSVPRRRRRQPCRVWMRKHLRSIKFSHRLRNPQTTFVPCQLTPPPFLLALMFHVPVPVPNYRNYQSFPSWTDGTQNCLEQANFKEGNPTEEGGKKFEPDSTSRGLYTARSPFPSLAICSEGPWSKKGRVYVQKGEKTGGTQTRNFETNFGCRKEPSIYHT